MKNWIKKITLSFLCGLAFAAPPILAAYINFPDVKPTDWFYDDVQQMVNWDVIRGNADGTFKPGNYVNRAELSAMWNRYNDYLKTQFSGSSASNDYLPTKEDWLKMLITHDIRFRIDSWEKRYGITPIIYNDPKIISVGITAANGEAQITPDEEAVIKPQLESIIEATVEDYDWAKSYDIEVAVF